MQDNQLKNIEAYDILMLINELKLSGAEAISINDQRIVNMSDVASVAAGFVMVNGKRLNSPYEIKAIGNSNNLESNLTRKYGFIENEITSNDKTATVEKSNNIKILKYTGTMQFDNVEKK